MVNALFDRGEYGYMSMHDMDCEWLRKKAYKRCIENADFSKVDKIVDGIKAGKINKANLFDEVKRLTKRVTSDHSLERWQCLTEWFAETEWS